MVESSTVYSRTVPVPSLDKEGDADDLCVNSFLELQLLWKDSCFFYRKCICCHKLSLQPQAVVIQLIIIICCSFQTPLIRIKSTVINSANARCNNARN